MTRMECEKKLLEMAQQMYALYKQYNPAGELFNVTCDADGYVGVDDAFFYDGKVIMDANGSVFHTVDAVKYKDGDMRFGTKIIREGAA